MKAVDFLLLLDMINIQFNVSSDVFFKLIGYEQRELGAT